jgi:hypothetical protein
LKKILSLFVIGILMASMLGSVTASENQEKEYIFEKITISQPNIKENEEFISIELKESTYKSWEVDKPSLPVISKVYTFPFNTKVNEVKVTFSNTNTRQISKPIETSPEVYIDGLSASNKIEGENKIVSFSDIEIYPEKRFSYKVGSGLKGEEHVVYLTVHFYPIQYKPAENIISYSDTVEIDIKYTPPKNPTVFSDEYDLLIIAPSSFESALQPLIDHKNNLEPPVRTIFTSLEEIPSTGVDDQESIKYYIKEAIENMGISYLLLVGAGVENEEVFPVRQAWVGSGEYEDYFPSDLYYADIYDANGSFSDWDFDEDRKYAEYSTDLKDIDILPDVYLGKLPANNAKEVSEVVEKIINYKAHNKMVKKVMQIGGDSFTGDSVNEGEYANTQVLEKLPGYETTQLWASTQTLTKQNVANSFNEGVDFVDLCGHGSWASFATHPPGDDETWVPPKAIRSPYTGFLYLDFDLFAVLNSKKLPVCVYKSCSNNKYSESPNCFGWKTVSKKDGGGIAAFAASGISYGATGTDITKRTTGWMEVKSFEELLSNKILGQVWGNSITDYYNTFELELENADWKTLLEWSMFGDPTLVIEDGDDPEDISVNRPIINKIIDIISDRMSLLRQIIEKIIKF